MMRRRIELDGEEEEREEADSLNKSLMFSGIRLACPHLATWEAAWCLAWLEQALPYLIVPDSFFPEGFR